MHISTANQFYHNHTPPTCRTGDRRRTLPAANNSHRNRRLPPVLRDRYAYTSRDQHRGSLWWYDLVYRSAPGTGSVPRRGADQED